MILFEAHIPPDLLALSALRKDVSARLMSLCPNDAVKSAILLTISEMGANVIRHADPEPTRIGVRLRLDGAAIIIEIEDDGGSFHQFEAHLAQALIKQSHLFAESGRGLSMIQGLLDDLQYEPGAPNRFIGKRMMGSTKPTILVVEDSPILLETYAAMLARDYHVLKSSSLEGAIALTHSERIACIVTDLHLEGREGSELVDVLEADIDRPPVPVLVITGEKNPASIARAVQAGVEQVIPKPVSADTLTGAISSTLARNARQNARLFRYFGGSIDHDGEDRIPARIGPFRLHAMSARAGFGRGDFMCMLRLEGGKRIVVADVMGHGLAAQLAGMRFKSAICGIHGAWPTLSAGDFIAAISRALCREPVLPGSFLTMMVVDLFDDGRLELSGGGHPRSMLLRAGIMEMVASDGPLPGLIEQALYPTIPVNLSAQERLFIPTDGIDPRASLAGLVAPEWLARSLGETHAFPFDAAMLVVDAQIRQQLTHSPVDDWTLLAIERIDAAEAAVAEAA